MKIFSVSTDGGSKSGVTGFWLVEIKSLFSIVFLRFSKGTREAFHSHAFNALTWWLKGRATEFHTDGRILNWKPSFWPKYTPTTCFHKVYADETTYALSIRGPWNKTWQEFSPKTNKYTVLTNGRKVVNE